MPVATDKLWRCVVCKTPRKVEDALPPLESTLTPKFMAGKCRNCKRAWRFFEPAGELARDLSRGVELKERGMARAEQHATFMSDWTARFDAALHALALSRQEFTSEDVTARAGLPPSSSGSAVGARMNAAAKRGLIIWTQRMRPAERPNQHAALLKVWRGT